MYIETPIIQSSGLDISCFVDLLNCLDILSTPQLVFGDQLFLLLAYGPYFLKYHYWTKAFEGN